MSSGDERFYMSGAAIPAPRYKDKPPAITVPLRQRKHVREHFVRRRAELSRQSAPNFAGDDPHTCAQCENIVIDFEQFIKSEVIPICDNLEAALGRAAAGCAFFEWLVDLVVKRELPSDPTTLFQGDACAEINFGVRLTPWSRGLPMRIGTWAEFIEQDGKFLSEELEGGKLLVLALTDTVTSDAENISAEELPTRLLHLDTSDNLIRLVNVALLSLGDKGRISRSGYASLSYCWGGPQPLCLTDDTIAQLTQGIDVSILPPTLRDAVTALSFLGLEYIWIDALCIKQDDDVDKELEISRMSLYYGHNTVTISAASAAACTEGFLASSSTSGTFAAGPFRIPLATPEGAGNVQLTQFTKPPAEPIASRGWTYQESLLSRRLVIFGSREVYWTCNTVTGTYGGSDAMSQSKYSTVNSQLLGTTRNLSNILEYPFKFAWSDVVKEFMTRQLGVESDKLLAIAALASRIAQAAEKQGNPADQLLWRVDSPQGTRRAGLYRAPSWSWACIDGVWGGGLGVLSPLPFDIKKYEFNFQVTDFAVKPTHPSAPFGNIRSAYLIVQGWLKRLDGSMDTMTKFSLPDTIIRDERDGTASGLYVLADTVEDVELVQAVVRGKENKIEVYIIELIPPFFPRGRPSVGLVLRGRVGETMVRVGVYVLYAKLEALETFFDGLVEDIRLI
ncbi:hypothetical protein NPX13_g4943 [Xylaria arbuscula]|uniref:Heterokaryon incompatibility domain-containing protein n=1 Tax=Xylaria arbuscula TaxID=114810 RepID=A0A9W8NEW7_9PEZI|nr:hypothetical protein NPX13_g4943 [Xylaria arbuscula]